MPTADLLTIKLLLNGVIPTPTAKFMTMDIKNFYLKTQLKQYEYIQLKRDVLQQYEFKKRQLVRDGCTLKLEKECMA